MLNNIFVNNYHQRSYKDFVLTPPVGTHNHLKLVYKQTMNNNMVKKNSCNNFYVFK